jgi:hypothetical protein
MIEVTPGPLPIHFFTIVVKTSALDRSFPGGRKAFIGAHDPGYYNGSLFCLSSMGPESVEWHVTRLEAAGITLGVDAVLADMTDGPEVECPGLLFTREGEGFDAQWTVDAEEINYSREQSGCGTCKRPSRLVAVTSAVRPSGSLKAELRKPAILWRRHAVRGGQVFWFGNNDDD